LTKLKRSIILLAIANIVPFLFFSFLFLFFSFLSLFFFFVSLKTKFWKIIVIFYLLILFHFFFHRLSIVHDMLLDRYSFVQRRSTIWYWRRSLREENRHFVSIFCGDADQHLLWFLFIVRRPCCSLQQSQFLFHGIFSA